MKIEFILLPNAGGNAKASVHQSGKMGFSTSAIEYLKISENSYARIGINQEDKADKNLYIQISSEQTPDSLKINKAGAYYYLNTKQFFDKMGVDYQKSLIIYDIVDMEYEGQKLYKFIRRTKDRKKSK